MMHNLFVLVSSSHLWWQNSTYWFTLVLPQSSCLVSLLATYNEYFYRFTGYEPTQLPSSLSQFFDEVIHMRYFADNLTFPTQFEIKKCFYRQNPASSFHLYHFIYFIVTSLHISTHLFSSNLLSVSYSFFISIPEQQLHRFSITYPFQIHHNLAIPLDLSQDHPFILHLFHPS